MILDLLYEITLPLTITSIKNLKINRQYNNYVKYIIKSKYYWQLKYNYHDFYFNPLMKFSIYEYHNIYEFNNKIDSLEKIMFKCNTHQIDVINMIKLKECDILNILEYEKIILHHMSIFIIITIPDIICIRMIGGKSFLEIQDIILNAKYSISKLYYSFPQFMTI
jgi:hypothetical protein